MDDDIQRAIERIDEKIRELQEAKQTLVQTFGATRRRVSLLPPPQMPDSIRATRKEAIKKALLMAGPQSKAEIIKATGFPEGTVSYVLNDKDVFKNLDGKWHLVEGGKQDGIEDENKSQDPPF